MSGWGRPRNIALIGGVLAALAFMPTPGSKTTNPFQTQGSKNIEDRWSSGGGSTVHTPGVATPRGNSDNVASNQTTPSGIRSDDFQEKQAEQRPGAPGPFDKAWNQAHYGTDKGK